MFQGGTLLPLHELRQFIAAAQPLVGLVPPTVKDVSAQIPPLSDAFRAINYTTNEIAWNPGGANQGFLYWMPWFAHNSNSFLGNQDGNGAFWRGEIIASCDTLLSAQPTLEQLLAPVISKLNFCGKGPQ